MAGNWLCLAEALRPVLLKTVLNVLAVHGDAGEGAGSLGRGWHRWAGLCLHSAGGRGAASPTASDHRLWSGVPLPPAPGCHEGRVKENVPRGSHPAQRPPQGTESPTAPLQGCLSAGVWGSLGKEEEALPGADPDPHACCPLPAQPCLPPSLPVPLHPQKHSQGLSPVVRAPALQTPLLLLPPCGSSRLPGQGCWRFDEYSLFHIGFPLTGAALLGQRCCRQRQHCSNCRKSS